MAVVKEICNKVAVMEKGRVVEEGDVFSIFANPQEALTQNFIKTTSNLRKIEDLVYEGSPVVDLKPGELIVRLSYIEKNISEPLISAMTYKFNVILNIIFANIEIIQDAPIGGTVAIMSGKSEDIDAALDYLRDKNVGNLSTTLGIILLKNSCIFNHLHSNIFTGYLGYYHNGNLVRIYCIRTGYVIRCYVNSN